MPDLRLQNLRALLRIVARRIKGDAARQRRRNRAASPGGTETPRAKRRHRGGAARGNASAALAQNLSQRRNTILPKIAGQALIFY